jgi:RHH-type proline utilization regulon transcriptional repressor/proline dehydrogenase/delta 1-pyrroline-5-carboxylate dehydrogenase
LDENTAPGSFLGDLFALEEGSPEWERQKGAFLAACQRAFDPELASTPNRTQDRGAEEIVLKHREQPFANVANTDFSLPANRRWCQALVERWRNRTIDPVPISFGGQDLVEGRLSGKGRDPSRPGLVAYGFAQGTKEDLEVALQTAVAAQVTWSAAGIGHRAERLRNVAKVFAEDRGDTIGTMMLDAGKAISEADVEISEAIDFAEYYSRSLDDPGWFDGCGMKPFGVVVVTPPWNFPYAIPAGGVLAALMAGNSVILKPARESVLTAYQLARQCWKAGIPKEVLQFLPLVDGATGKLLITDPRVDAVILTGSIFTARMFQQWRPDLRLYAETSGKNCMIITVAADLDLAIKDLVRGAFGHAGQKCSATSVALVQKEVYDDPRFMAQLKDAAESLRVGGSWDPAAVVTPVIREPDEFLDRGLRKLDDDESWLLEPKLIDNNPCLWRPGIRIGVRPNSWYHKTECFGPVLGLIRVDDLDSAIAIQNSSEFGLTGGLHSLDPHEIAIWRQRVEVGNAYINRSMTGAIVRRQPFGGWKDSCVGPGPKAGGPNYVAAFCHWHDEGPPHQRATPGDDVRRLLERIRIDGSLPADQVSQIEAAAGSYVYWWEHEFSKEHDPSQLHGETNHFRYRPRPWHILRIQQPEADAACATAIMTWLACATVGIELQMSMPRDGILCRRLTELQAAKPLIESDQALVDRLATLKGGTLRIVGKYDRQLFAPSRIGNIPIIRPDVLANGRVELLNYLREQSVSQTVHRYGNII